ncbi:hypothetical protein [Rahnella bonaserana]|jgi:serine/threonine protein kinase|uniref:Peptidase C58 YopT-type domain-containing protein n=1 Tax=Rahnella bonaserana TaxID=2816248 RepID=A0ABS6LV94_9GAMM|nr:hypothetical protein [Rahnella bonaserana]MBU9856018.1 hypothetical protein [Rahnella bonaserana]MCL9641386.1 hypothetical protein [Rahnella victoriana]WHZ38771.1 hypothetical protein QNM34_11780 [Rahnella bonaserana]
MFRLIRDFRAVYNDFLSRDNNDGYCMGLSLTWLGDMLKNRTIRKPAPSAFQRYPKECIFPSVENTKLLIDTFERARLKQLNMEKRVGDYFKYSRNYFETAFFIAKYKNRKQIFLEEKYKVPGMRYTHSNISTHREIKGLDINESSSLSKQGVIIIIDFGAADDSSHAVAAFRYNKNSVYYLDANYGLYHITGSNPTEDIERIIRQKYGKFTFRGQILITA